MILDWMSWRIQITKIENILQIFYWFKFIVCEYVFDFECVWHDGMTVFMGKGVIMYVCVCVCVCACVVCLCEWERLG